MESVIQTTKECYICKNPNVHKHHVFFGTANRKLSDEDGMIIYLCAHHHNAGKNGVHQDRGLDISIKQIAQRRWEEIYGDREQFRKRYGKSYL